MLFDVVVGNPPYKVIKEKSTSCYQQYKTQLYSIFTEKSILLLSKEGFLSILIPTTFKTDKYKEKIRDFIKSKTSILSVIDTGSIFDSFSIYTSIVFLKKKIFKEYNFLLEKDSVKEYKDVISLSEIYNIYLGIQILNRSTTLSYIHYDGYTPIIDGRDIHSYTTNIPKKFFSFKKENCKSGYNESLYDRDSIVIPQCRDNLCASIRSGGCLVSNTAFNLYPKNEDSESNYPIFFVLALLNSSIVVQYFKNNLSESKSLFPKINKFQIEKILIPSKNIVKQNRSVCLEIIDLSKEVYKNFSSYSHNSIIINKLVSHLYRGVLDAI